MNPVEFANIAKSEEAFWWYRGMRRIMFRVLDPIASGRRVERALEAGCGTGHFARALEERYRWPMFPADLGWEGVSLGRRLGVPRLAQADIAALPYAAESFDAVVSMDVKKRSKRLAVFRAAIPIDLMRMTPSPGETSASPTSGTKA